MATGIGLGMSYRWRTLATPSSSAPHSVQSPSPRLAPCFGRQQIKRTLPLTPEGIISEKRRNLTLSAALPVETAISIAAATGPAVPSWLAGLALFLTPGMLLLVYATIKGKGNTKDGLSRVLTEVSQDEPCLDGMAINEF